MLSHQDLDKRVSIVFSGGGVHSINGTLTDYDDANSRWIEVRGVISSVDRRSALRTRHVIPMSGIAYIRFDNEEEKP